MTTLSDIWPDTKAGGVGTPGGIDGVELTPDGTNLRVVYAPGGWIVYVSRGLYEQFVFVADIDQQARDRFLGDAMDALINKLPGTIQAGALTATQMVGIASNAVDMADELMSQR